MPNLTSCAVSSRNYDEVPPLPYPTITIYFISVFFERMHAICILY